MVSCTVTYELPKSNLFRWFLVLLFLTLIFFVTVNVHLQGSTVKLTNYMKVFRPIPAAKPATQDTGGAMTWLFDYSPVQRQPLYILQGYLDQRVPSQTYITFIGFLHRKHEKMKVKCLDLYDGLGNSRKLELETTDEWLRDDGSKEYVRRMWRCGPFTLWQNESVTKPVVVLKSLHLRANLSLTHIPPLEELAERRMKYNFTLCLSPIHGKWIQNPMKFHEFMQLSKIFGLDHVHVYDVDYNHQDPQLLTTMQYYQHVNPSRLTYHWWNYPRPVNASVDSYYFGQLVAWSHCLHQAMLDSEFAVLTDFDEILVPRPTNSSITWVDLVTSAGLWNDSAATKKCAACYPMLHFLENRLEKADDPSNLKLTGYFSAFYRQKHVNQWLLKCVTRPRYIISVHVHQIEYCLPGFTWNRASATDGVVHHYKTCHNRCKFDRRDESLRVYEEQFNENMRQEPNYRILLHRDRGVATAYKDE